MRTYLITLWSPPGPPPEDLDLTRVMADIEVVNDDIRAAGGWVFAGGLDDPALTTTLAPQGDGQPPLVVDGPFAEAREHFGGLSIVKAPDLDVVLGWATRLQAATGLPIEVRPFIQDGPGQRPG